MNLKTGLTASAFLFFIFAFFVSLPPAQAAQFQFKNGQSLEGKILFEEKGQVYIETRKGLMNVRKEEIEAVREDAGERKQEKTDAMSAIKNLPMAVSKERILSFHSDIEVHPDASLSVTETIKVYCGGIKINHGIYRDFPLNSAGPYGTRRRVDFKVIRILRDGKEEPYHIENNIDGVRVSMGNPNVLLSPGEYTYTFSYHTDRQLKFLESRDMLYWNVTGTEWEFEIREASARVKLPPGAASKVIESRSFVGTLDSRAPGLFPRKVSEGDLNFSAGRELFPGQGLTFFVSWPKGYVSPPDPESEKHRWIQDNRGVLTVYASLPVILFYFFFVWACFGKDPVSGSIMALYEAPQNLSPASARYIIKMGYDDKCFAAAVLNMAVKGNLIICENEGTYSLEKTDKPDAELASEEKRVLQKLFAVEPQVFIDSKHANVFKNAVSELKRDLSEQCGKKYFFLNLRYSLPGLFLSLAALIVSGFTIYRQSDMGLMIVFSIYYAAVIFGTFVLTGGLLNSWKIVLKGRLPDTWSWRYFTQINIAVPMLFLMAYFGTGFFIRVTTVWFAAAVLLLGLVNALFWRLLKAPTFSGRKMMDQIEGFKMFLSATEKNRLRFLNPPEKTSALFEKCFPYAVALDADAEWGEQFSQALGPDAVLGRGSSSGWYIGTSGKSDRFVSEFELAFSSAVSISASSGSGDGGRVGGGGGGGGGGGW